MEFVNLSNVCDVYSGYAFKKFNDNKEGMPVIKIGNIKTDGSINKMSCSYTDETPLEKFFSQKDDLYIALSGATTGKVGIMDESGYLINQRVGVIRRKDMNIPINYIKFFLDSITEKILKDAVGAAQPNISPRDILEYKFPLRTYNEMFIISNVLTKINSDIKKCKNYITNLDNIVKSQFIEMFGACNCRMSTFGNEFSFISRGKSPSYVELSDLAVINQACIYWNGLNFDKVKYNDVSYSGDRILQFGDVLVNSTGTGTLGRANVFMFRNADKRYMADSHVTIIRGSVSCHPVYIKCYLEQIKIQDALYRNCVSGSTNQIELSKEKFKVLELPVPPMALQQQFATFVEQIDKSKFIIQKQIKLLEELLESKMNEYFGQ